MIDFEYIEDNCDTIKDIWDLIDKLKGGKD